jgi:hypothetical protein
VPLRRRETVLKRMRITGGPSGTGAALATKLVERRRGVDRRSPGRSCAGACTGPEQRWRIDVIRTPHLRDGTPLNPW